LRGGRRGVGLLVEVELGTQVDGAAHEQRAVQHAPQGVVERHVEAGLAVVGGDRRGRGPGLAHQERAGVALAQSSAELRHPSEVRWRVGDGAVLALDHVLDRVDAEAVDAEIQPEGGDVEHRLDDLRVAVVEVGHVGDEQAEVTRAVAGVVPGAAAERPDERLGVALEAVPAAEAPFAGAGRDEPRVAVARVVDHQVEHDPHPVTVGGAQEGEEVGQRAEFGVDAPVVGDVVAVVTGRRVDGGQPQARDAEARQVRQPGGEAAQVADAVAVRVLEAAHEDLVVDAVARVAGPALGGRRRDGRAVDQGAGGQRRLRGRRAGHEDRGGQ
jgi:hypothetical protein